MSKGLRTSWDTYAIVITVRDARGHVVDFSFIETNDLACAILDTARDELLDEKLTDVSAAECARTWIAWLASVVESEESTGQLDISLIDDVTATARRVDVRAVSDGDVVGFTFREKRVRPTSSEGHDLQLRDSSHIMAQVDRDGKIEWLVDTVHDVLGFRPAELVGTRTDSAWEL